MTTFTTEQNDRIISAFNGVKLANAAIEREQGKREGAYTVLTATAIEMSQQDFADSMADLIERIRSNTDGIAPKVGAKKGDKGAWKVPSSVSSAKSVLTGCFEYGVPMLNDEGEPVAFSQLRKDLAAAKQAEADAERQPAEIARDELVAALREAAERVAAMEPGHEQEAELLGLADMVRAIAPEADEAAEVATLEAVA